MLPDRLIAGLLLGIWVTALVLGSVPGGAGVAAAQNRLTILASTSILADVVRSVAGDAATVESLFPPGVNAHSAEPSAQDVARLSDAEMVMTVGNQYEEGLLPVLQEASGSRWHEVSGCVPLRPITIEVGEHEASTATSQPSQTGADSMNKLCAAYEDEVKAAFGLDQVATPGAVGRLGATLGCDAQHSVASCDRHVWTDPVNVGLWTVMIRDMLSAEDPANADVYAANADAYLAELAALHQQISALVARLPAERRVMLTNHLTFGYFAARYGFTLVGVIIPGGSTTAEPSTQDVLALIQTVQQYKLPTIFSENVISDSLAQQIADETGARVVQLYTESLSEPGGKADTYLKYMVYNTTTMVEALK